MSDNQKIESLRESGVNSGIGKIPDPEDVDEFEQQGSIPYPRSEWKPYYKPSGRSATLDVANVKDTRDFRGEEHASDDEGIIEVGSPGVHEQFRKAPPEHRFDENDVILKSETGDEYSKMASREEKKQHDESGFQLKLNVKALDKVAPGKENPERIAVENFVSFCTQSPDEITEIVFENDGRNITGVKMKTDGSQEIVIPAHIFRSVFVGVSQSTHPRTHEVDGVKFGFGEGAVNIFPGVKQEKLDSVMRRLTVNGTHFKDSVKLSI